MTRIRAAEKQGSRGERRRPMADVKSVAVVICAFCGGKGRDPFEIMSPLATCQVCGGCGRHSLRPPVAPCAFCQGTGVYPQLRNACTACHGVGQVEIPADAVACPCCGGSGRAADYVWPDSPLSCGCCQGKGVVSATQARLLNVKTARGPK